MEGGLRVLIFGPEPHYCQDFANQELVYSTLFVIWIDLVFPIDFGAFEMKVEFEFWETEQDTLANGNKMVINICDRLYRWTE